MLHRAAHHKARTRRWLAGVVCINLILGACGDDTNETLHILVTNDDGIDSPGIDSIVEALGTLPDVELAIVAPAGDQSGTGRDTSGEPVEAEETTTVSGEAGIAVDGFPADAVVHAFDEVFIEEQERPHLVVSGNNEGPNLGFISYISGTVGAARVAADAGVPGLAVSQGLGDPPDFEAAVPFVLEWVEQNREALLAGRMPTDTVASLNVPTCEEGEVRGLEEVPLAQDAGERSVVGPSDCTSTETDPIDDIDGFLNGFATLTDVPVEEGP